MAPFVRLHILPGQPAPTIALSSSGAQVPDVPAMPFAPPAAGPNDGPALWRALPEQVRQALRQLYSLQPERPVALWLDVQAPEVAGWPWELLAPDDRPGLPPFACIPRTPLARAHPSVHVPPAPRPGPLRLLALTATPRDQPPIDTRPTLDLLARLRGEARIAVAIAEHGAVEDLPELLARARPDLLLTLAHGEPGALLLEDRTGESVRLPAAELATLLAGTPVRAVVLASCYGATQGGSGHSAATALLEGGALAVVAMRGAVPARAADAFLGGLLASLARGLPIEVAAADGRRQIIAEHGAAGGEWTLPVCWQRALGQPLVEAPPLISAPLPTLHQLRAPVSDFVGRAEEIDAIVAALGRAAEHGAAAAISGVRGLGGVGKTELAYAAAQRIAPQFPDAQLLIELGGAGANPLTPEQALQSAIHAFEREARLPDDLSELQRLYRSLLSDKRALILADDARDAAQVALLLPPAGSALLVTSRVRFSLPGMDALDLGALPQDQAEALLLAIGPRIGGNAARLAQLCGRLPLALRISASLLANDRTLSVANYLERLADERARLAHLRDPDDPALSVEASLALSYDALDPRAQAVLCQLSVFPASFDRPAAEAVVALPDEPTPDHLVTLSPCHLVLGTLYRRSLLDYDEEQERYSLHDLVRAFATARLDGKEEVRARHAHHYAQVADQARNLYHQGGEQMLAGLALFDRERIQIDAGWAWARSRAGEATADELLLEYANATAYFGDLRYDLRYERIPHLDAALAAARRLGRKDIEGATLNNLGLAYAALGEPRRAIEHHEYHLALARETCDRRGEGAALGNLGVAYKYLGELRRALEYHKQRLNIAYELGDRRGEGNALGNLGVAYADLGEMRRAVEYYEQVLVITQEIGDQRAEGSTLGNLGAAYAALGELQRAIKYHGQHLAIAHAIGDRRSEANALNNLGIAYDQLGEPRRAIEYYEQHLALARAIGDRRGEGNALGGLGNAYYGLGEPRRAVEYHEQHLALAREIGDRRGESNALGNLGLAYYSLGEPRRAVEYYEQTLAIAQETGDRAGEARRCWNLGLLLEEQGDLTRAVELMQILVEYEREIGHPDTEQRAAYVEQVRRKAAEPAAHVEQAQDKPARRRWRWPWQRGEIDDRR